MYHLLVAAAVLGVIALAAHRHRRLAVSLRMRVSRRFTLAAPPPIRPEFQGRLHPWKELDMAEVIRSDQGLEFQVKAIHDRLHRKAKVDGPPTWLTSNSDIVTLEPSADGMKCKVIPTGMIGTAQVQVTVDVDLGESKKLLIGTAAVEVQAAEATHIQITAGEPFDLEAGPDDDEDDEEEDDDDTPVSPPVSPPPAPEEPTEENTNPNPPQGDVSNPAPNPANPLNGGPLPGPAAG